MDGVDLTPAERRRLLELLDRWDLELQIDELEARWGAAGGGEDLPPAIPAAASHQAPR